VRRPFGQYQKAANRTQAKGRKRVEHVFADQQSMGEKLARTIGLGRARMRVGLTNPAGNLRRRAAVLA